MTKKRVGKAVDAWYKEKQYYHISTNKCDAKKVCGHYKQVALYF
jgi:pathogenesis-related protein 1